MEPALGAEAPQARSSPCDVCRARKVKCDRGSPCSSCKAANIPCRTTKALPEKRQRVLISPRYEQEVATVNSRLERLEKLLQEALATSRPAVSSEAPTGIIDNPRQSQNVSFEGETSFATHARHATTEFEKLVSSLPRSKDGEDAVASLRRIIRPSHGTDTQDDTDFTISQAEFTGLPLPPRQLVIEVLGFCKNTATRFFRDSPFLPVATFTEMCQQVYFPTQGCSMSVFIIVNVGLCNVFRDLKTSVLDSLGLNAAAVASSISICTTNIKRAVKELRLTLDPSFNNIVSLILLASMRMDWDKPSFDWRLISHAAILSQEAGYHRLPKSSTSDENLRKRLVFWFVRGFDIMFSFNLGRSPTVPEDDITTEPLQCPGDVDAPWGFGFVAWQKSIRLQYEIYQALYSGRAQAQPIELKIQAAQVLVSKLTEMRNSFWNVDCELSSGDLDFVIRQWNELIFYSSLTLVHRAIPLLEKGHALQSSDACTSAARNALRIQNRAWERTGDSDDETWKLFIHWTMLHCPFVPFIVVFGNLVATGDEGDLRLLDRSVASLESAARQSPTIAKLHHVCSTYYKVGRVYLDQVHKISNEQMVRNDSGHSQKDQTASIPFSIGEESLPVQDWDTLLDDWNLGFGQQNALEVSSFFSNYFSDNLEHTQ